MVPAVHVRRSLMGVMRRGCVAGVAVLAVMALATGFRNAPASAPARAGAPAVHGAHAVTGLKLVPFRAAKLTVPVQTGRKFTATQTRWPSAASGAIALAAPGSGGQGVLVADAANSTSRLVAELSPGRSGTAATEIGRAHV